MAATAQVDRSAPPSRCDSARGTLLAEFADLLIGDDEWVEREFDALVQAGWSGDVPERPTPRQGPQWPRRLEHLRRSPPARWPGSMLFGSSERAHQRGPPPDRKPTAATAQ